MQQRVQKTVRTILFLMSPCVVTAQEITLQGTCIDKKDKPVRGAEVSLYRQDDQELSMRPMRTVFVNAKGMFRFDKLPEIPWREFGQSFYLIVARSPGHGAGMAAVRTREVPLADLRIRLGERARVQGRVFDETGLPLAAARVWLRAIYPHGHGPAQERKDYPIYNQAFLFGPIDEFQTTTNEKGEFELGGLPRGVRLRFDADHPTHALSFTWCKAPSEHVVSLFRAGVLLGRVVYAGTEEPAAKVKVCAQGTRHSGWGATFTDRDGRYRIPCLRPDAYNVWAECKGWTVKAHDSFAIAAAKEHTAGDLVLIKGGWITGRVVDENGKGVEPGEWSSVSLYGPSRPKSGAAIELADIQADGTFKIRAAPGRNYIYLNGMPDWIPVAARAAGKTFDHWVTVVEGKTLEVEFVVQHR